MGFMTAPAASGDFNTYIKFDARAGRWFTKPDGGGDLYEVTNMSAIMDVENIRTGWIEFGGAGQAPIKVFDPSLSEAAPKPGEKAKRGFEVLMFSEKNIGGLREFSSTAKVVIDSMNAVYDEWMAGKAANPGKVPVVKSAGVTAVKAGESTNYQPALHITAWVDRPAELVAPEAATAPPTAAPAQHAAPPPAVNTPAPQMATAGGDEPDF